jgi:hypothetical protein
MRFDTLVEQLLTEMPHLSFDHRGQIFSVDLKIEDFKMNYDGFVQYVKNIFNKLNNEDAKNKFIEELKQNKHLNLALEKMFNIKFENFLQNILN